MSAGIASTPSIQRQLPAPVVRIRSLEKKDAEMPMTIISWLIAISRPRRCAGAISAMYMGAVRIAAPTASPPRMRATMKAGYECAVAARSEEPKKSTAVRNSTAFRP